ncbi:hypothetical protein CWI36_2090p0020 [Hamiltosporidium magnivora]|uniref:Uncharacterized protein n=1 Tax=Hamiltosporidium magnivora TaxID=148818 RepID=A0A4Q9KW70_9MICR|nr:hypothetical protein CWI36_2090p0020 [Hamiltosporidium magnivora]
MNKGVFQIIKDSNNDISDPITYSNSNNKLTENICDIIEDIKKYKEIEIFGNIFRKQIQTLGKLNSKNFTRLKCMINTDEMFVLISFLKDMTKSECIVVGRAYMKTKVNDIDKNILFHIFRGFLNINEPSDTYKTIFNDFQILNILKCGDSDNLNDLNANELSEYSNNTTIILTSLLCKRKKICVGKYLTVYLSKIIRQNITVSHLRLLLVVSRNYKECFSTEITDFCRNYKHPIINEILKNLE